jgi:hypothetical protein
MEQQSIYYIIHLWPYDKRQICKILQDFRMRRVLSVDCVRGIFRYIRTFLLNKERCGKTKRKIILNIRNHVLHYHSRSCSGRPVCFERLCKLVSIGLTYVKDKRPNVVDDLAKIYENRCKENS